MDRERQLRRGILDRHCETSGLLTLQNNLEYARKGCLPSRIFFSPRPTLFPGLQTTSIDAMLSGRFRCSSWRAFNEAMLNSSDPQKRMRRGSYGLVEKHLDANAPRSRSGLRRRKSSELPGTIMVPSTACCWSFEHPLSTLSSGACLKAAVSINHVMR